MTAKEKVLKVWPEACAKHLPNLGWLITRRSVFTSWGDLLCTDAQETEEAAWQNAAKALPAPNFEEQGKALLAEYTKAWPVAPVAAKETASLFPPLGERSLHFEDDAVIGAIDGTDCLLGHVRRCLGQMTTGEKWSLYRAVVKLSNEASAEPDLAELLRRAKPATGEELRRQRESYAANYKPGPRQCVPAAPVGAKEKEQTGKVWQACGSTMCVHDECLDCWPMNRANFGPDDVIETVAESKPAPSTTEPNKSEGVKKGEFSIAVPSPLPMNEEFVIYRDDEDAYIVKARREGQYLASDGRTPDDAVYSMRIVLDMAHQLRPRPDSSSIPDEQSSTGELFYDGQEYIFLQTAHGPTMFAEIRGAGGRLPKDANAQKICDLWNAAKGQSR
jgi:hypothetical protein